MMIAPPSNSELHSSKMADEIEISFSLNVPWNSSRVVTDVRSYSMYKAPPYLPFRPLKVVSSLIVILDVFSKKMPPPSDLKGS